MKWFKVWPNGVNSGLQFTPVPIFGESFRAAAERFMQSQHHKLNLKDGRPYYLTVEGENGRLKFFAVDWHMAPVFTSREVKS